MVIQGAVSAVAIVERFDVIEDLGAGLLMGEKGSAVNQFQFESAPEAFDGGIVVAIGFATHGGDQARLFKGSTKIGTGVLDATIGMK